MKYVYLIRSQESGRYKIGISKDPTKRVQELQTGNDADIILVNSFYSKYPTKVESALQNKYSYKHNRGEWFDLGLEEEVKFLTECDKIEKNIEYLLKEGNLFV